MTTKKDNDSSLFVLMVSFLTMVSPYRHLLFTKGNEFRRIKYPYKKNSDIYNGNVTGVFYLVPIFLI